MPSWDRIKSEPANYYAAFCVYRDLGPERSLDQAWRKYAKRKRGRAPGAWNRWRVKYGWDERAASYDAHLDQKAREAKEKKQIELIERRAAFEFKVQEYMEELAESLRAQVQKHNEAPVIDVTKSEDKTIVGEDSKITTVKTTTTFKAMKTSGLARLSDSFRKAMEQAVTGVRPGTKDGSNEPMPDFIVNTKK